MIQFIFIVVQSIILRWAGECDETLCCGSRTLVRRAGSNMYFLRVLLLITGGESSFESRLPALSLAALF